MKLTEAQRVLVREKLVQLSLAHERRMKALTKDFEAERQRLELMLQTGVIAQKVAVRP